MTIAVAKAESQCEIAMVCVAGLVFDPHLAYRGAAGDEALSYYDIMLTPLIEALSGAMESNTKVNSEPLPPPESQRM